MSDGSPKSIPVMKVKPPEISEQQPYAGDNLKQPFQLPSMLAQEPASIRDQAQAQTFTSRATRTSEGCLPSSGRRSTQTAYL